MYERYEHEAYNHEKIPSKYFLGSYHLPYDRLRWIDPYIHHRCYIFRNPDNEGNQEKSESQVHRIIFCIWSEMYLCPSESEKDKNQDNIAEIPDKVMGKKVYIDRESDHYSIDFFWISGKSELEYPPDTSDIAPDGRVHKSCKEGHSENTYGKYLWILPRPDRGMRLKYFHPERHTMEYRDNPDLFPRLELYHDEKYLESDRREKEEVISIEYSLKRIIVLRHDDYEHEKSSEYTGVGLLINEGEEVV
jgi:hypothetical protein